MTSTPEERKTIVSRLLKEGATQAEIAKAIGMSVATVNKAVKEIRAEETPACDLQKMDTLSKGGTSYRVTDVTGAVITAKSIVGDACIKPKEVTIPVAAYVSGKSGYRKLDIPPVKVSRIEPTKSKSKPSGKNTEKPKVQEANEVESRANHENVTSKLEPACNEQKRVETSNQSAKADAGKLKLSLVPTEIIYGIARVREYGNQKYADGGVDNWKTVDPAKWRDALYRHLLEDIKEPWSVDEESGLRHLEHMACNIAFLLEMETEQ